MTSPVRLSETRIGKAVVAARAISTGECLVSCEGEVVARPTRYSVFVAGRHIEPVTLARYVNHSCEPNAKVCGDSLVAIRPIDVGEMVTFDYERTEPEIAAPFDCLCGTPACRGRIGKRPEAMTI